MRPYLYFCTNKASTFVLVKQRRGLPQRCVPDLANLDNASLRQYLYLCAKTSTFVLVKQAAPASCMQVQLAVLVQKYLLY
jgi:hypothetical protein